MSTAAAFATTTSSPFDPQPAAFAAHIARFKAQETCPPILPLLDRSALRLLAVWSPDLISSSPSSFSSSSSSSFSSSSSSSAVRDPSSSVPLSPQSSVLTSLPSPSFSDLWSSVHVDFTRLATLTGLNDAPLRTAFCQVKAHRLIYPDGSLNTHVKDILDARTHRLTAFARRRRLLANRANAIKSTGPRSDQGKAVSALNALKHALTAETPILLAEKPEHYDAFVQALRIEYDPQGITETLLVDQLTKLAWRLQRADKAESRLNVRLHNIDHERVRREVLRPYQPRGPVMPPDAHPGHVLVRACEENLLSKIDRHYTTLHRAFFRTLHELQEIQGARHNPTPNHDLRQVGFVLQNDIPPSDPTPATPTPSDPSDSSTQSTPSTLSTQLSAVPAPRTPHPAPPPSSVPEPRPSSVTSHRVDTRPVILYHGLP